MRTIEKRTGTFTESMLDDEIVVMRTDTGEFFSICGAGLDIWPLIDGTRDRSALLMALEATFDAPERAIADDLDGFLAALAEAGLIERT